MTMMMMNSSPVIKKNAVKSSPVKKNIPVEKNNPVTESSPVENIPVKKNVSAGWRTIGGKNKYFRSRWEANFARYLQNLKKDGQIKDWFHEPKTFWFEGIRRGVVSYLPDFKIINIDESWYYVEVKGYMDSKSKTKLKRFAKYFPEEVIILVNHKWFKENFKFLVTIIPDWERGRLF